LQKLKDRIEFEVLKDKKINEEFFIFSII